jgi:2-desacetyl-2-hydroxyethyl bacteriochlorophyllide A dehydrogenase
MPFVPGHEYVGTIEKTGGRVESFKVGQLVTAEPGVQCNNCIYCRRGDYHLCSRQTYADGAFADYVVIKEWKTYAVPKSIDAIKATLTEPIACALHSIELAGLKKGQNVLIHGAGPIGQALNLAVRYHGAGYVAITDLYDKRLEIAKRKGADLALHIVEGYSEEDLVKDIGSDFIDVVFDTVSNGFSMNSSVTFLKYGGMIVVVGVPSTNVCFDLGKVMYNELRIVGDRMYKNNFTKAIDMLKTDSIDTEGLISTVFELKEIAEAFKQITAHKDMYLKCIVKP